MAESGNVVVIEIGLKELAIAAAVVSALVGSAYLYIESLRPAITVTVDKPECVVGEVVTVRGVLWGGGSAVAGADVGV